MTKNVNYNDIGVNYIFSSQVLSDFYNFGNPKVFLLQLGSLITSKMTIFSDHNWKNRDQKCHKKRNRKIKVFEGPKV